MIRSSILWMCVALFVVAGGGCRTGATGASERWQYYGRELPDAGAVRSIGELKGGEKSIIVEGTIGEVCKTMGCWVVLRDEGGYEVFVQTRDHEFFVPRNASGHRARVWGEAVLEEVSVASLRHFAHDAGRSEAEIEAIREPMRRVTFYADSIVIAGGGLERAEPPVHQR